MAEPRDSEGAPTNYDETRQPNNPPNSVLRKPARRGALWSYLGPIVVLFVIMGFGLVYWNVRKPAAPTRADRDQAIGTSGEATAGGFDPQPRPSSTADEVQQRGGVNDPAQGPMPKLHDRTPLTSVDDILQRPNDVVGRSVVLANVTVDSAEGDSFWVRDGNDKVQVVAAPGISVQNGTHVRVVGTVEAAGNTTRVHASKVDIAK